MTTFIPWTVFGIIISALLILDLGVLNKKDQVMSLRQSLTLSAFYITIACIFGLFINIRIGGTSAAEYYTGFLLEKTMSLDNVFVISIIFNFFNIPIRYQHRVLFWGIFGVIILRGLMIYTGAALLTKLSWVLYIFAAILIYTGIKTFHMVDKKINIQEMYIYKFIKKYFNVYPSLAGNKFLIYKDHKWYLTPLFMALVTVEVMDLVFAIDSIPAIFAVTQNTYIVYTSNIFAILGLRALYFCLTDIVEKFKYIKYSLAVILILIGIKIFIAHFIKIPTIIPLAVTATLIIIGIIASIIIDSRERAKS